MERRFKRYPDPAVEPLIAALKSPVPNIRCHAVEVLGDIKDPRAVEPIIEAIKDSHAYIRRSSVVALREIKISRDRTPHRSPERSGSFRPS